MKIREKIINKLDINFEKLTTFFNKKDSESLVKIQELDTAVF